MPTVKTFSRSFAGGEITPELFGRLDLDKRQTGLKKCRNLIVLPHGPVKSRPGFQFIRFAKYQDKDFRLMRFQFSISDSMVLEFGDQYIRFHTSGGTMLDTGRAISVIGTGSSTTLTFATAHGLVSDRAVYIDGTSDATLNGRFYRVEYVSGSSYKITDVWGNDIVTSGSITGGTANPVYEVATSYLESELFNITHSQSSDVVKLCHIDHPPRLLSRLSASAWSLTEVPFTPTLTTPTGYLTATAYVSGGGAPYLYSYRVTVVSEDGLQESLPSPPNAQTTATLATKIVSITGSSPAVFASGAAHGLAVDQPVLLTGMTGDWAEYNYTEAYVQTVVSGTQYELRDQYGETINVDGRTFISPTAHARPVGTGADLGYAAGNRMEISWPAVPGAKLYNVYKRDANGSLFGYIGQTSYPKFTDANILPDRSKTPPGGDSPFVGAGNYPGAVGSFDQRAVFGGTENLPQAIWLTRSGTESNMLTSVPLRDDDSFALKVRNENNLVKHIITLNDMVVLTNGGEWRVFSTNGDALTPSTATIRPQSFVGANNVEPVFSHGAALYVQHDGRALRELVYKGDVENAYQSNDASVMVPHLMEYQLTDLAFNRGVLPIIYSVNSIGQLLGMTYLPEHRVMSWHQHDTNGLFKTVCTVTEAGVDRVYVGCKRTINGNESRTIERMYKYDSVDVIDETALLDCSLVYEGSATTTITGLWHLEGATVQIMADGAEHPDRTVTNGSITLEAEAERVVVGFGRTEEFQTLPLVVDGAPAAGIPNQKAVDRVYLRLESSGGLDVSAGGDSNDYTLRTGELYGEAPDRISGIREVPVDSAWDEDAILTLTNDTPIPVCIISLVMEVSVGG